MSPSSRPIIKVCGMRDPDNIRSVEALHPDWMGFILWPGSKRFVATPPAYLPDAPMKRVGVFVDPTLDEVTRQSQSFGLHLVQFHGHESPDFCREAEAATGLPIIKAFTVADSEDVQCASEYSDAADYFLFDTKSSLPGGNGRPFDWDVLEAYSGSVPFLLSGGIGPDALQRLSTFQHPRCIGIDLNSRFEVAPALKDITLLHPFITQLSHLTFSPTLNHHSHNNHLS